MKLAVDTVADSHGDDRDRNNQQGAERKPRVDQEQKNDQYDNFCDVDEKVGDDVTEEFIDRIGIRIDLCHQTARLSTGKEAQRKTFDRAENCFLQIEVNLSRDDRGCIVVDNRCAHGKDLYADDDTENRNDGAVELAFRIGQYIFNKEAGGKIGCPNAERGHSDQREQRDGKIQFVL